MGVGLVGCSSCGVELVGCQTCGMSDLWVSDLWDVGVVVSNL